MRSIHTSLAAGRWAHLTIVEQLANVGSEIDRAIRALEAGRVERHVHARARALELLDLTASDPRWRGPRRREILRARECFCGMLFRDPADPSDAEFLRKYFLQFAVAARRAAMVP